ncbi:unnamed protein product [Penicillium salamii]|uniref:FAD/NAD(P)-binding domain-containing protein n=1 Tax=Penicillium salamii TaxID=1612424 RepID=A0A9W4K076_9EURO|nr:unnamed protein product [Penicillium salamii]CAG8305466.1 unnamed protein product [Penicillium salamii]CAG8379083.1 unnamed protein product [Penicillium salamii]CAG8383060.1 unnamed protein product [Penicillium salamii]CAG8409588.1 unnamed protein product [Penicillium salamii]
MDRVVIVGAGLYGLIAAKTYLQVTGAYDDAEADKADEASNLTAIPACFTEDATPSMKESQNRLLVIDSASDIGGTWAEERLYPNLLSQNSYGLYEFSDLPLTDVVPEDESDTGDTRSQFIAGWKIRRYLRAWVAKWKLDRHVRLKWTVGSVCRLESKEWKLSISLSTTPARHITVICDKLVLATGLTSVPNLPEITDSLGTTDHATPVIHAKDVGGWARQYLGYQPLEPPTVDIHASRDEAEYPQLRSVAIYGGAKSSFDLVHFFATLHRKDPKLHLKSKQNNPVQVHWIIRDQGAGVAWMVPPTSTLPNGDTVPSDKAASTRLLTYLTPCCYMIPKRLSRKGVWGLRWEGSWLIRLLHGNPFGRWWVRWFWRSVDRSLEESAQYGTDAKMELLRPANSVVSCASGIGIANQGDLWEAIRLPHVAVHRSTITKIVASEEQAATDSSKRAVVHLADHTCVEPVDLVIHATGYKPIVPIQFEPASLRLELGLSALVTSDNQNTSDNIHKATESPEKIQGLLKPSIKDRLMHLEDIDQRSEVTVRQTLQATGCTPMDRSAPSWTQSDKLIPYRLFRRMIAPELVAQGDRSFATLGVILSSTIAVIAEVQALWVAAFLTGGLDIQATDPCGALSLEALSLDTMDHAVSEDAVLGSMTGSGLEVDAIQYNDMLLRDLGINPNRLGGGTYQELTGVYGPSAYKGIVDEWKQLRTSRNQQ